MFFVVGLLYIAFRSKPVQSWLAQSITEYLSTELKTKVKVSGVDIAFFKTAIIEDLYVEDQAGDTMFYFRELNLDYNTYKANKRLIDFNAIAINGGKVYFGEHKGDSTDNYEFLLDYFDAGPRDPNKPKIIWTIHSQEVALEDVKYDYFQDNDEAPDFMAFNYNQISFSDIHASLSDFYLIDDSMHFITNALSAKEKCGFELKQLQATTNIHAKGIEFEKFHLYSQQSEIEGDFKLLTNTWKDYNQFNDNVTIKANITASTIRTSDLAFFSDELKPYDFSLQLKGQCEGPLSQLRGHSTEIKALETTVFKGDWSMTGLPNFDNTILDINVKQFKSNYHDLEVLSQNNMPSNFAALGTVQYQGSFIGFYNDFVSYGNIATQIGNFKTDINIKYSEGLDKAKYSGTLSTDFFKINSFIKEAQIDDIGFDVRIDGVGMSRDHYRINLDGKMPHLTFNGHTFKNITAKGEMSKARFAGQAQFRDENLDLDFDGEFRSDLKVPSAHFTADIHKANLKSFGLDHTDQWLKGVFNLDFVGKSIDDAQGSIVGESIAIERNGNKVNIPYVNLSAYEYNDIKELKLRSDIVDAGIKGQFKLKLLDVSILHLMHQLIPAYFNMPKVQLPKEDFVFEVDLKRPYDVTSLYLPKLQLEPCVGKGSYNSSTQALDFAINNKLIVFDQYEFKQLRLKANKVKGQQLKMAVDLGHFTDRDFIHTNAIHIESKVYDNSVDYAFSGIDTGFKIGIQSLGDLQFHNDSIEIHLKKVHLSVANDIWRLDSNASALIVGENFSLSDFVFRLKKESIFVDGALGPNTPQKLSIAFNEFSLNTVNYFAKHTDLPQLNGHADGNVFMTVQEGYNAFHSDIDVFDFSINGDTIGDLSIFTKNQSNSHLQHLKVYVDRGLLDSLRIEGELDYKSVTQNYQLHAFLPPTDVKLFQPYLDGIFAKLSGKLYTTDSLSITGTFSDPIIKGGLELKQVNCIVDFLNSPLQFSAHIDIDRNSFNISPFAITDQKKGTGMVKAVFTHQSFNDFKMDLELMNLKQFQVLNTSKGDNELFYGQGFANGNAQINGPFDALDLAVQAKTTAGTKLYIPISEGEASSFPNYVHFKTNRKKIIKESSSDFPLHSLVLDIEATNDADVEIIFDEILGDKITGTGHGDLKLEMNQSGDFFMFGNYTVDKGRYLFTAFDLYNKPFNIRPGGSITWYGDPLDAKLNIVAYNSETTSPSPLLTAVALNSNFNANTSVQAVTVESELYLKGNLFLPEVSFGLNFPKLQSEAGNYTSSLSPVINRIKSDREEVNRQVFSLLLMKKFLPPMFAQSEAGLTNAGSTALSSAGTDLLSNQLSNWLNKIDPNWKVNVIYKNGSITLPAEYGLLLSSKFLNDKLTFDGSFSNYSSIPNINLEYKLTKKGNVKIKAYTRSSFNQVNTTSLSTPITTNGVGVVYTKEFNVLRPFKFLKRKGAKRKVN